jgi:hypothetical protein
MSALGFQSHERSFILGPLRVEGMSPQVAKRTFNLHPLAQHRNRMLLSRVQHALR